MKNIKKNELNVDFIGGQDPLTKEEEQAITDYINAKKKQNGKALPIRKTRVIKRKTLLT